MKLLFDESLSPRLVSLLSDLFPESESALRNGLARVGDRKILEYAAAQAFVLVSTDSDFELLLRQFPSAKVVILRSCDYPTEIAADVLRRNSIRIAELLTSPSQLIIFERWLIREFMSSRSPVQCQRPLGSCFESRNIRQADSVFNAASNVSGGRAGCE